MKIGFITDYALSMGGKERQLLEISKSLMKMGIDVMAISLSKRGILCDCFNGSNIPFHIVSREETSFFKLLLQVYQLLKREKIQIVYSFDSLAHLLAVLPGFLSGAKLVNGSIRDAGVDKGFAYLQARICLILSHAVIANSFAGLNYYGMTKRGIVLYNAIDRKRFKRSIRDKSQIVMVANFTSYKNQHCLIEAAIILLEQGYNVTVGFVGGGPLLEKSKIFVASSKYPDRFEFYGLVSNTEEILTNYGIGVLSSTLQYGEGVSNSILEYMGAGLISVASDVGATREIIDDGENGFIFKAEDSPDLADKLKKIINEWEAMEIMRECAYKTLDEKFNAEINAKQLVQVAQGLMQ